MATADRPAPAGLRRRDLLATAAGAALLALALPPAARAGRTDAAAALRFVAARRHADRYEAAVLDAAGHDVAVCALPDRGHSFAIDAARQRAVVFGRQPGFFALGFDLRDGATLGTLPLQRARHFFGHGVFSADGDRVFATENDFETGRGVLGVYEARPGFRWQRLGEIDTGGIGPHEVVMLQDGRTLCVANGGLLTHPDYGKDPLNLSTMRPSLAYLDAHDGRLLEQHTLPPELYQLSIRHLAVDAAGDVWFACQHQGPATEQPPLVDRHRRGEPLQLLPAPVAWLRELRNYIGSIAIDARGHVATSSPVGGHVAFWDAVSGTCTGVTARPDGCGVAALDDGRFLLSDGFGALVAAGPGRDGSTLRAASGEISWDNHLRRA